MFEGLVGIKDGFIVIAPFKVFSDIFNVGFFNNPRPEIFYKKRKISTSVSIKKATFVSSGLILMEVKLKTRDLLRENLALEFLRSYFLQSKFYSN